jgi:hypothetical protein
LILRLLRVECQFGESKVKKLEALQHFRASKRISGYGMSNRQGEEQSDALGM